MTEFKFHFKTNAQLDIAESTGYIDDYSIVRCKIIKVDDRTIDFPVKTEEDYLNLKKELKGKNHIKNVEFYPATHYFDINEYD